MNLWALYRKDLRQLWPPMFFLLAVGLIWHGIWFYKFPNLGNIQIKVVVSFIFPLVIMPLSLIWFGVRSLRKEWQNNTVYTLLSLPQSGQKLTGSKLLAVMTYYLSIIAGQIIIILFTYWRQILAGISILETELNTAPYKIIIIGSFLVLLWGSYLYLLAQFSYLAAKIVGRFNLIVSIMTFISTNYLLTNLAEVLAPLFSWVSGLLYLFDQAALSKKVTVNYFSLNINDSGEFVVWVLFLGGIYWLNSFLLTEKIDI